MTQETIAITDCLPIRQKRKAGRTKKSLLLEVDTHGRLVKLAKRLNVTIADAVETLLNYIDELE